MSDNEYGRYAKTNQISIIPASFCKLHPDLPASKTAYTAICGNCGGTIFILMSSFTLKCVECGLVGMLGACGVPKVLDGTYLRVYFEDLSLVELKERAKKADEAWIEHLEELVKNGETSYQETLNHCKKSYEEGKYGL